MRSVAEARPKARGTWAFQVTGVETLRGLRILRTCWRAEGNSNSRYASISNSRKSRRYFRQMLANRSRETFGGKFGALGAQTEPQRRP